MTKSYKISYTQPIEGKRLDFLPNISFCEVMNSLDNAKYVANNLLDILNPGSTVYIDDGENIKIIFRDKVEIKND